MKTSECLIQTLSFVQIEEGGGRGVLVGAEANFPSNPVVEEGRDTVDTARSISTAQGK